MNISVENLNVNYCDKEILKDVSFQVKSGEVITIIGPNGSGKSTLIKALSRCLRPVKGNILFDKNNINTISTKDIARKLSVLPQEKNISLDISVEELVSYGRFPHLNFGGKLKKEDNDIISWAMEKTRLENMRKRLVHTLSGGERQRAWIAMSLAQKPQVMILDEPTTYLDISYQLEILELIKELNDTLGITVIMVLHDLNQASRYSDKIMVIDRGEIYQYAEPNKIINKSLLHNIFKIDADIYKDEINKCMYFIPNKTRA